MPLIHITSYRQEEVDEIIRQCEEGSTDNLHHNMETLKVLEKSFRHYEEQIQQVHCRLGWAYCSVF